MNVRFWPEAVVRIIEFSGGWDVNALNAGGFACVGIDLNHGGKDRCAALDRFEALR